MIAEYLGQGRNVVTNLPLFNVEMVAFVAKEYGWKVQPGQLIEVHPNHRAMYTDSDDDTQAHLDYLNYVRNMYRLCPPGPDIDRPNLIVWDESRSFADAKQALQNVKANEGLRAFIQQGRHFHINSIFIIQSVKMLESGIVNMCTEQWAFFDFSKIEIPALPITGPGLILRVRFEEDGKTQLQPFRKWIRKSRSVYKIYDSHDRPPDIKVGAGPNTFGRDKPTHQKYMRGLYMRYMGFFIIAFIIWAFTSRKEKKPVLQASAPGQTIQEKVQARVRAPGEVVQAPRQAAPPAPRQNIEKVQIVSLIQEDDGPWVARTADGRTFRQGDKMGMVRVAVVDENMRFITLDVGGTPYYLVHEAPQLSPQGPVMPAHMPFSGTSPAIPPAMAGR